jgi:hypothetical protein
MLVAEWPAGKQLTYSCLGRGKKWKNVERNANNDRAAGLAMGRTWERDSKR